MQSVDIALLRNNVAFTMSRKKFSNSRKVRSSEVKTEADSSRINASKKLLVSDELDAIHSALDEIYSWCINRSMPSFFKKGIYLVKADMVPVFDAKLREFLSDTLPPLVSSFMAVYNTQIEQSRKELNGLFDYNDYPPSYQVANLFGVGWNYLTFGVPDNLPSELREIEAKKLAEKFAQAEEEILYALREGFVKVVEHVTERLLVAPGEQPKTFRNTLFESLSEFVETFNAKNMMSDEVLDAQVRKAKDLLALVKGEKAGEKAEAVRDNRQLRDRVAAGFAELKTAVAETIINRPSRKFELED